MTQRFGVVALLLSLAGLLGMAGKVAPCDPSGRDICNLERPEDIAFIPGTDWFAVSTSSTRAPLVFIAAHSKRQVALALPFVTSNTRPSRQGAVSAPGCPGPPTRFRAGGNDIRRVGSELRMLVINHPEPGTAPPADVDRVEMFTIQMRAGIPSAVWRGCFPVPAPYALNDVAIGSEGEIYASHQYERTHSPEEAAAARQKFLSGTPTGFGLTWKPGKGWTPFREPRSRLEMALPFPSTIDCLRSPAPTHKRCCWSTGEAARFVVFRFPSRQTTLLR